MNIIFITHFVVGCMVSEIQRVSVFGNYLYSVNFHYIAIMRLLLLPNKVFI